MYFSWWGVTANEVLEDSNRAFTSLVERSLLGFELLAVPTVALTPLLKVLAAYQRSDGRTERLSGLGEAIDLFFELAERFELLLRRGWPLIDYPFAGVLKERGQGDVGRTFPR